MLSDTSAERLATVHPELARRVRALADVLASEGIQIEIDAALRTTEQQDELYAIGRTEPGKVVTNAQGCQSNHVIGCAVDSWVVGVLGQPDWNPSHSAWQRIVTLAPDFGLRDGKSWHDLPHLELVEIPTEPTAEAQRICKDEGVQAVWNYLQIPEGH